MLTFEGKEYLCSTTSPYIPYTLYVHEGHLLLVPRKLERKNHPQFPTVTDTTRRFTLRLSDYCFRRYTEQHGKPPKFAAKQVSFGFEEDEGVVVAALLPGSNMIPYWDFRSMLTGTDTEIKKHFTDESSDPQTSFGLMDFDLKQSA